MLHPRCSFVRVIHDGRIRNPHVAILKPSVITQRSRPVLQYLGKCDPNTHHRTQETSCRNARLNHYRKSVRFARPIDMSESENNQLNTSRATIQDHPASISMNEFSR
jgi:hypothetical protein